jgi:hypothetical protein
MYEVMGEARKQSPQVFAVRKKLRWHQVAPTKTRAASVLQLSVHVFKLH